MGGTDLYVYAGRQALHPAGKHRLWSVVQQTPYVDGSGLKNTLERETVTYLQDQRLMDFSGKRVLMVCSVDRFGMAEALAKRAKSIVFGDLMFGLGVPIRDPLLEQRRNAGASAFCPSSCAFRSEVPVPDGREAGAQHAQVRQILCRSRRDRGRFPLYPALHA